MNILSGDRDLFQLVDDQKDIYVLYMGGGPYAKSGNPTLMNENGVKEKLGVAPERVVDLKALTGDSSDNIPGIKGCLLYTSPSPRDYAASRMPSSA